jgi:uncharacterized protein with HEPN domain
MTSEWKDQSLLLDMLNAAVCALEFTSGLRLEEFSIDHKTQSAVVYQIQIIGEAARKISSGTKQAYPSIDWSSIVGMRNRLVHDYSRIDIGVVWEVVTDELPLLVAALERIVPPPEE